MYCIENSRISIKSLEVYAYHGVLEEEKLRGQFFYIDLDLYLDLAAACDSDNLYATVNYDEVCSVAAEVMRACSFDLIERAAAVVAATLLDEFQLINWLEITLRKPSAPTAEKIEHAAVSLVMRRGNA